MAVQEVLLVILVAEILVIAFILYRKFSNKTVPSSVTESGIQQIQTDVQKDVREHEARKKTL